MLRWDPPRSKWNPKTEVSKGGFDDWISWRWFFDFRVWGCCSSHESIIAPSVRQPREAYSHGKVLGTMKHHNHLFLINEELPQLRMLFCHMFFSEKGGLHRVFTLQNVIRTLVR